MLQTILTILSSGLVAGFVSVALANKKETFLYKQKKAEDLYRAADSYIKMLSAIYILRYPYVKNEISEQEMQELTTKSIDRQQAKDAHPTLWMLVSFYFPEIDPALREFDKSREAVNSAVASHTKHGTGLKPFDEAFVEFDKSSKLLLEEIVKQGRQFSRMPSPFEFLTSSLGTPTRP